MTLRALICGDRNWIYPIPILTVLDGLSCYPDLTVIEGCARGADWFAHQYVADGVKHLHFPADWEKYGRKAGPMRNVQMLEEGKPDIVVAFHNDLKHSKGTQHMVKIAHQAGIPTYVMSYMPAID